MVGVTDGKTEDGVQGSEFTVYSLRFTVGKTKEVQDFNGLYLRRGTRLKAFSRPASSAL